MRRTPASRVRQAVLVPQEPFGFSGGSILTVTLKHEMKHATRNMGRFRLSITASPDPEFITRIPAQLRPLLAVPSAQRKPDQQKSLSTAYRRCRHCSMHRASRWQTSKSR